MSVILYPPALDKNTACWNCKHYNNKTCWCSYLVSKVRSKSRGKCEGFSFPQKKKNRSSTSDKYFERRRKWH